MTSGESMSSQSLLQHSCDEVPNSGDQPTMLQCRTWCNFLGANVFSILPNFSRLQFLSHISCIFSRCFLLHFSQLLRFFLLWEWLKLNVAMQIKGKHSIEELTWAKALSGSNSPGDAMKKLYILKYGFPISYSETPFLISFFSFFFFVSIWLNYKLTKRGFHYSIGLIIPAQHPSRIHPAQYSI